jgi:hypothetical protein
LSAQADPATTDRRFPGWYRVAVVEPDPEKVQRRWPVVAKWANENNALATLELVRLAHSRSCQDSQFLRSHVHADLQAQDPSMAVDGVDLEIGVLAAAALIVKFGGSSTSADVGALGASSARFGGWAPLLADLPGESEKYLAAEALSIRTADSVALTEEKPHEGLTANLTDFSQTATSQAAGTVTFGAIQPIIETLAGIANQPSTLRDALDEVVRALRLVREEADVLWWLVSDSDAEGQSWEKAKPEALALMMAVELAERTCELPGLPNAEALLRQAVPKGKRLSQVSLADGLDAAPPDWRSRVALLRDARCPDMTPVVEAVVRSTEVPHGVAWAETASAVVGFDLTEPGEPVAAAMQLYRELMLLRSMQD